MRTDRQTPMATFTSLAYGGRCKLLLLGIILKSIPLIHMQQPEEVHFHLCEREVSGAGGWLLELMANIVVVMVTRPRRWFCCSFFCQVAASIATRLP